MPIDQFNDRSFKQLYKLINEYPETENLIKTANIDHDENEKCAASAFAWPEERLFRIDSPAQAALSRLYIEKQAGVPGEVRERCDKALELYGIKMALQEKVAEDTDLLDDYLLPEIKRLRVVGAESAKLAAATLLRDKHKLDPVSRARASIGLVKKAMEYNTSLPDSIYKMAGVTMSHVPQTADWLEARAVRAEDPAIKKAYEKLAHFAREKQRSCEVYWTNRDELVKLADAIEELDAAAGLQKHYDTRLPDPMDTVFNTNKISEDTLMVGSTMVPMSKLLAVPVEMYADVFGEDIAADFVDGDTVDPEALKAIWDSIPLDLKQALANQMGW